MLAEKTDGKLEVVVHSGGALGYKGPELLKAVRDGLVPMSDMLTSGVAGDEPLFTMPTLPFLVRGFKEGKLLTDVCRPYFDEVAEKKCIGCGACARAELCADGVDALWNCSRPCAHAAA